MSSDPTTNPTPSSAEPAVIIERTLSAPVDLVWKMWTDAEHFKAWYGPTGATIPSAVIDATVGGIRHVCMEMQGPEGAMQMWFVGQHVEVDEPQRLAYTESMSDPDGNVVSPEAMGMPGGHPEVTQVAVDLVAKGAETGLTLTHAGVPSDSPGAMGWNMALDKLEAQLTA
jgi:uncharacterized protein YndB with AHSA1/START domain